MRVESRTSAHPSTVRGARLAQHQVRLLEGDRGFVLSSGLGLPRSWGSCTQAVLRAAAKSLDAEGAGTPHERLTEAAAQARRALLKTFEQTVERQAPDATILAALMDPDGAHILRAGSERVYLRDGGTPERKSPREEASGGLLTERAVVFDVMLSPGSLLLCGSVTAFTQSAVDRIMNALGADPDVAPSTLAALLTEPSAESGKGSVAVVTRVR